MLFLIFHKIGKVGLKAFGLQMRKLSPREVVFCPRLPS